MPKRFSFSIATQGMQQLARFFEETNQTMTTNLIILSDYSCTFQEMKGRVRAAWYEALKAVNRELIALYWDIGRIIVDRQQGHGWGNSMVERLAANLQQEFPGFIGFSASSLWRMRSFYVTYAEEVKLAPWVREIGWSHNVMIMGKCHDANHREFYLRMTRNFGWTKNVLALRKANQTCEKTLFLNRVARFYRNCAIDMFARIISTEEPERKRRILRVAQAHSR